MRRLHTRIAFHFIWLLVLTGLITSTVHILRGPGPRRPLITVAVLLTVLAIGTWPLSRRITRPIELLTAASRRFGAGDLSYRIPIPERYQCEVAMPGDPDERRAGWHGRRWRAHHRHRHGPRRPDELYELVRAWNEMADRIERLLRGQRELLANVSHELRSPLTRVRVALELLPRNAETEVRLREVESDLADLERLIDDVLTTTRLSAGGLPTRPAPVAIPSLFQQLVERATLDPLVTGKPVQAEAGPDLPDLVVQADAGLLRRALFNLIENAAKYGAPPITLSARQAGSFVELSVTDEGVGIPAADRERVLEPFYRGDKARTPGDGASAPQGFGLGLTLARRVAEAHGGEIRIGPARTDSTPQGPVERGCRVTLRIPQGRPTAA